MSICSGKILPGNMICTTEAEPFCSYSFNKHQCAGLYKKSESNLFDSVYTHGGKAMQGHTKHVTICKPGPNHPVTLSLDFQPPEPQPSWGPRHVRAAVLETAVPGEQPLEWSSAMSQWSPPQSGDAIQPSHRIIHIVRFCFKVKNYMLSLINWPDR